MYFPGEASVEVYQLFGEQLQEQEDQEQSYQAWDGNPSNWEEKQQESKK